MPIQVLCRTCNKKYAIKDKFAGKKLKCPGCGEILSIPMPGKKAKKPANGELFTFADDDAEQEVTCTDCGAVLPPASKFCVTCGFHMGSGAKIQTLNVDEYLGNINAKAKPPIPCPVIVYVLAGGLGLIGLAMLGFGFYKATYSEKPGGLSTILMALGGLLLLFDFLYVTGKKMALNIVRFLYVALTGYGFSMVMASLFGGVAGMKGLLLYIPLLGGAGYLALKSFDPLNDEYCCL